MLSTHHKASTNARPSACTYLGHTLSGLICSNIPIVSGQHVFWSARAYQLNRGMPWVVGPLTCMHISSRGGYAMGKCKHNAMHETPLELVLLCSSARVAKTKPNRCVCVGNTRLVVEGAIEITTKWICFPPDSVVGLLMYILIHFAQCCFKVNSFLFVSQSTMECAPKRLRPNRHTG